MEVKLLLIFTDKIFTEQSIHLARLDEQLQIAFQILINKGCEVLVSGDSEQSFKFAKKFSYVFQDKNIRSTENKLDCPQKSEVIKNSNCVVCFQEEDLELIKKFNKPFIFIDIQEKNAAENEYIEDNFDEITTQNLNAGKIVEKVKKISNNELKSNGKNEFISEKDNLQKSDSQKDSKDELEEYKKQVKKTIEQFINENKLDEAKSIISEYESIVKDDVDIYSMRVIMYIIKGDLKEAEKLLDKGLSIYPVNFDLLYNFAYLYEIQENYIKAYLYYRKAFIVAGEGVKGQIENKISELESMEEVNNYTINEKLNIDGEIIKIKMKKQMAELEELIKSN